jgi:hypothetical protein
MVDRHAALLHHLLEVTVPQRISGVPTDADQDHVDRKTHTFEVEHVDSWIRAPQFTLTDRRRSLMQQNFFGSPQNAPHSTPASANCRPGGREAAGDASLTDTAGIPATRAGTGFPDSPLRVNTLTNCASTLA